MDIYKDIEMRTNGEIYMGVVGPVRTGKSTFIKRFMDLLVIPSIQDEASRVRAKDELPQSAAGKTVMTTEPKFIPQEAAHIVVGDGVELKCRMIDCVGYMVNGAEGHEEDGKERLVKTPWYDYEIPFTKAAEIGTRKVIYDHSTVGIVVTCDGSITDISRDAYIEPETRTVEELKSIGKPFIMLLNSRKPASPETVVLAEELAATYGVSVLPVNCDQLKKTDVNNIFRQLLLDFPVTAVNFNIPKWVEAMDSDNKLKSYLIQVAKDTFDKINQMKDIQQLVYDAFSAEFTTETDLSNSPTTYSRSVSLNTARS